MTDQVAPPRAYLQVALMFAIIIATLALGFFMVPGTQQERDELLKELGTTNHGELLTPLTSIAGLMLTDEEGSPWLWSEHNPKWRLLIPATGRCDGECEALLHTTRQVHVRLGKYTHRVERVLLAADGPLAAEFRESLATDHPYLKVMMVDGGELARWLAATNHPWQPGRAQVILVDPEGMAMMSYDIGHNGIGMLEDLNHLLKYSPE